MLSGEGDKSMKLSRRSVLHVKGQAELIGTLFAFMVLVMFIVYIVANVLPLTTRQQLQIQEMQSFKQLQELEEEGLEAVWNSTSKVLEIYNNSTIPIKIVRIWVEKSGIVEPEQVSIIVEPKGKVEWTPPAQDIKPLRVETSRGTMVDVKNKVYGVYVPLGGGNLPELLSELLKEIALKAAASRAFVGFLAERDYGGRALDMNPNRIHYVRINLVTGEYELIYIDGDDVKTASGRAKVLKDTNVIDLSKLSWEERYKLGPVIVFVNPYFAAKDYEVEIIDIRGTHLKIPMEKLVDDKSLVGLDALVCWEDLWWPGTSASLDDYQDHIVRVTVFTNNVVRIEIVYTEAGYIHVFFIDPPSADKGKLQDLVRRYMDNNYRLPFETGVVYVKAHNVEIPPLDSHDLWDPVAGEWVTEWPPEFYR